VSVDAGGRKITQYTKEMVVESSYIHHTFSEPVSLAAFAPPNLLTTIAVRPNNIGYDYSPILFRCLEQITWNADFSAVQGQQEKIKDKSAALSAELKGYRHRIK
jgi:hypothetical protein